MQPVLTLQSNEKLAAAAVIEFYPLSNTGLLGYLVVDEDYRGKKLSNQLLEHTRNILQEESKLRSLSSLKSRLVEGDFNLMRIQKEYLGNEQSIDEYIGETLLKLPLMLFCECENGQPTQDQVMDPKVRHEIYRRLGFGKLQFDYIQRLSLDDTPIVLLLLAQFVNGERDTVLSIHSVATFILEFYKATFYTMDFPEIDNCYSHVMKSMIEHSTKDGKEQMVPILWNTNNWDDLISIFKHVEYKTFSDSD